MDLLVREIKQSGFGRAMGVEGLRAMCQVQHLSLDRVKMPARTPLGYPYTEQKLSWIERLMRVSYGGAAGPVSRLLRRVMGIE